MNWEANLVTSGISPFQMLARAFCRLPVTCVLTLVSCFLFALSVSASFSAGSMNGLAVKPGALDLLAQTEFPDVYGMILLWKGEWWRLTISAFHHGDLLHLIGNVLAFWIFADLIEGKLGGCRYLAFCLLAGTFSMLPEIAIEKPVVGISGIICAQLGIILVLRRHDEKLVERMNPLLVPLSLTLIFVGVPLTLIFDLPLANGAHMLGLLYGTAVGWLCYDLRFRNRLAAYSGMLVMHLLFAGAIVALMHPLWNGRYFAWQAIHQTQKSAAIANWKLAVAMDPAIEVAWRTLALHELAAGDRHKAWVTVLTGARLNRSSTTLNDLVRIVWREFDSKTERDRAYDELEQTFGDETEAWLDRFELPLPGRDLPPVLAELPFPDLPAQSAASLDALLDVPPNVWGITRPLPAIYPPGTVNPDDPESASLGTML
jgi:rhomboid protease GluP